MILNWCNPSAAFTDMERIVGVLFDASVIRRRDLMFLLNWKRSKTDHLLLLLRKREMLITARDHAQNTVYMLSGPGVRFAHQLMHIEAKVVVMEAQISHQLGVNDILFRYVHDHGRDGVRWFSTREAADELHFLRKNVKGHSDADIRSTYIRPDALLKTGNGIFWLEYDNNTESSRQIKKKMGMYVRNLDQFGESIRTVVWITPTQERADWLKSRWGVNPDPRITMLFRNAGAETSTLAGEEVKRQTV